MRRGENKTVERQEFQLTEIVCDVCAETRVDLTEGVNSFIEQNNMHLIHLSGGFGSRFLGDNQDLYIDVCSGCLEAWVGTFKKEPRIR